MLKHNQPYSVPYSSWPEWFFCFYNIYCKCSDTFQMLPFIFAVLFPLLLYLIVSYSPVKFELIKLKMLACKRELTTDFRIWPYFSCLGSPYFHLDYWLILMEDGLLFFLSLWMSLAPKIDVASKPLEKQVSSFMLTRGLCGRSYTLLQLMSQNSALKCSLGKRE